MATIIPGVYPRVSVSSPNGQGVIGTQPVGLNSVARWKDTVGTKLSDSLLFVDEAGNLTTIGRYNGRDVAADGTQLDIVVAAVPRIPSQPQKDALVGTDGIPSSSNKYVTDSDPRLTGFGPIPVYAEIVAFAGGGQGSATAVVYRDTVILSVVSTGDSVRLITAAEALYAGSLTGSVINAGDNSCDVFPPSGQQIYLHRIGQGSDVAIPLLPGQSLTWEIRNDLDYSVQVNWYNNYVAFETNENGLNATGNGSGAGVHGFGKPGVKGLGKGGEDGTVGVIGYGGGAESYSGNGVEGYGNLSAGIGVYGEGWAGDATIGVKGVGGASGGTGVIGQGGDGGGLSVGVHGLGGQSGTGVLGQGGTNSGYGVKGEGGTTNGDGVRGEGAGAGNGGHFTGGGSNGRGAFAVASGTGSALTGQQQASGYSLELIANTVSPIKATLHMDGVDAVPSGSAQVGDQFTTTTGQVFVCVVAGTPGTFVPLATVPETVTTDQSPTAFSSGTAYNNSGAGAQVTITLPVPVAGMKFHGRVKAAQFLKFLASTGVTIYAGNTASATAGFIRANAIGSTVSLEAIDSTTWMIIASSGTWTVDT